MTFEIAGVDYSEYIQEGSYECLRDTDVTVWIDANYKKHFLKNANPVVGTVSLGFASKDNQTYKDFVEIVRMSTIDMLTPMKVYVMDENRIKDIRAKIDFASVKIKENDNGYATTIVKLKFEEE